MRPDRDLVEEEVLLLGHGAALCPLDRRPVAVIVKVGFQHDFEFSRNPAKNANATQQLLVLVILLSHFETSLRENTPTSF